MDALVWKKGVRYAHSIGIGKGDESFTVVTGYVSLVHVVPLLSSSSHSLMH